MGRCALWASGGLWRCPESSQIPLSGKKPACTDDAVLEHDYDGEFRFDGRPIDSLQSLQSLDRGGRVPYAGTASKPAAPFYATPPPHAELLLGYAELAEDTIREGIARLRGALDESPA